MTIESPNLAHAEKPGSSPRATALFEWSVTASAAALVVGLYFDGWAHIRGLPEGFFTPWHAIIYGAVTAASLILGYGWLSGRRRGHAAREALPPGYGLSL